MNLDRYLILANSRKEGGRCIAGVDAGGAWVRPVSGEGTGELRSNQCLNSQGDALLPLDVVSATFGESVASNYQPEDFISLNEWKAADPITPDELHNWLELTVGHTADFLAMGSMDRISAPRRNQTHFSPRWLLSDRMRCVCGERKASEDVAS